MNPGESVKDFATRFLHPCHEIPEWFVYLDFMSQELKCLVHVSRNGEPPDFHSSLTLVDHETPHVSKRVPHRSGCKAKESTHHVPNQYVWLSPAPMEEIPEWLRNPMVKNYPSIPEEDITIPNPSLESNLHLYHPPSSTSHDSLHHDSLERSTSQASCVNSLDSQAAGSSCSHVQGIIIIQAEEQDNEDTLNFYQNIELPFLIDPRSMNLGETSSTINSLDQPPALGCHHSHAFVCCDEHPRKSYDLLSSHVHSN